MGPALMLIGCQGYSVARGFGPRLLCRIWPGMPFSGASGDGSFAFVGV